MPFITNRLSSGERRQECNLTMVLSLYRAYASRLICNLASLSTRRIRSTARYTYGLAGAATPHLIAAMPKHLTRQRMGRYFLGRRRSGTVAGRLKTRLRSLQLDRPRLLPDGEPLSPSHRNLRW